MLCLRKVIPEIDLGTSNIPYETMMNLKVSMEHFIEALKEIEPSALREVFVEIPNVRWEDVGGLDTVKQQIREAVEWPLKYPDLFKQAKINMPKGILLHGHPGTGENSTGKGCCQRDKGQFYIGQGTCPDFKICR